MTSPAQELPYSARADAAEVATRKRNDNEQQKDTPYTLHSDGIAQAIVRCNNPSCVGSLQLCARSREVSGSHGCDHCTRITRVCWKHHDVVWLLDNACVLAASDACLGVPWCLVRSNALSGYIPC